MLSKKDIEELATGAVKRYFNTCNLISPQQPARRDPREQKNRE